MNCTDGNIRSFKIFITVFSSHTINIVFSKCFYENLHYFAGSLSRPIYH